MLAWINKVIYHWYFVKYLLPAMWKRARGNFFCWRDTPTWAIKEYAELFEGSPELQLNEDNIALYSEARNELLLRNQLARRNDAR